MSRYAQTISVRGDVDDYQARDDFHTLQRAEEIKSDGQRHARAKAHAKKTIAAARKIAGRGGAKPEDLAGKGYKRF